MEDSSGLKVFRLKKKTENGTFERLLTRSVDFSFHNILSLILDLFLCENEMEIDNSSITSVLQTVILHKIAKQNNAYQSKNAHK